MSRDAIAVMRMPDTDDYLRLQQVRDWLGGQSWFDITQYRINPPDGAPMHWSRLVDIPLAAGIAVLTPIVGASAAEMIVCTAAPLLIMALAMVLLFDIASRIVHRTWALAAATAPPLSVISHSHLAPLRIDHHGWQLVLALLVLWALLDETRKRRSGAIAGAAAALWLNISLEGLPIVACATLLLGARWIMDERELPRLQAFVWTLALASLCLEALTNPGALLQTECDRVSAPYLLALGVLTAAAFAAGAPLMRRGWGARLSLCAAAGLALLCAMAMSGGKCLAGPFSGMAPLVELLWLEQVGESRSLLQLPPGEQIALAGFALLGCLGAAAALRASRDPRWATVLCLALAATALMFALTRTGGVAHAYAAPGAVFAARAAFSRARALNLLPARAFATALVLVAATPAFFRPAMWLDPRPDLLRPFCGGELAGLQDLPPSVLLAFLDVGSMVIAKTHHSVVATGHHRNQTAMEDVISAFTGPPDVARAIVHSHRAEYVVICANAPEVRNYITYAPDGLASRLAGRRAPEWLESLSNEGAELQLYRVQR